ncbi:hypothetical protein AB0D45_03695 [Streptomyces sp. NPDC048352]
MAPAWSVTDGAKESRGICGAAANRQAVWAGAGGTRSPARLPDPPCDDAV